MIKPGDSTDVEKLNKKLLRKNYLTEEVDYAFYYIGDDKFPEGYYDFISRTYIGNDKTLDKEFSELTENDVRDIFGNSNIAEEILEIINNNNFDLNRANESLEKLTEIINNKAVQGLS